MKLSHRLAVIVGCSILGLLIIAIIALQSLRTTMYNDKRLEIHTVLNLAAKQVAYFQGLEKSGKLTRDEAQERALEAMASLRDGNSYIFVKTVEAKTLVHPNANGVGKVNWGKEQANGKTSWQNYLDAISNTDFAFFDDASNRVEANGEPSKEKYPKINGIVRVHDWGWVIGFGIFVDDIDEVYWSLALRFIVVGFVLTAIVLALSLTMSRRIYLLLGGEPAYAAEVALAIADGDLSRHINGKFNDRSLLAAVAKMQSNLRNMIEGIQHGASQLSQATTSLTEQMGHINKASQQTSDATSSTAAAIEELSVSIDHISSSARETEENSTSSTQLSEKGETLVNKASDTITKVSGEIVDASKMIESLLDRSREIGGIASVIKDIADQTNLLALNAAIEAARAGEQGRGFAVVADEVRKLAERTTQATGQISSMIGAIQSDTSSAVDGMRAVTPQVNLGVEMASQAAATLREINAGASVTLSKVRAVAGATAEQSKASSSVAQNVERIAQMVEESAASVHAANSNVRMLENLAAELRDSVTRFRL